MAMTSVVELPPPNRRGSYFARQVRHEVTRQPYRRGLRAAQMFYELPATHSWHSPCICMRVVAAPRVRGWPPAGRPHFRTWIRRVFQFGTDSGGNWFPWISFSKTKEICAFRTSPVAVITSWALVRGCGRWWVRCNARCA